MSSAGEAAHIAREAGAVQKMAEFARLLEIVEARWSDAAMFPEGRGATILEVGSYLGGTLAGFRAMWPEALVISIDDGLSSAALGKVLNGHGAVTITGDSHAHTTFELALAALGGERAVDLLFIDGDHSESGCRRDVEMYGELLEIGGLLALHDVAPYFPSAGAEPLGPEAVWAELPHWVSGVVTVRKSGGGFHNEGVPVWRRIGEIIDKGPSGGQPDEWGGIGLAERL